jgi:hypothetical protein
MKELWQRWHISLMTWFRHYVYFPLGGSRRGKWRTALNTMIVFSLSGLWHGANWTFVIWGTVNGLLLLPFIFKPKKKLSDHATLRDLPRCLLTFLIFAAVRMLCPSLAPALQANVFPHIAIYCGIAVLFYVGQWLVYKVLGYTFSDKQGTKLWIDGFKATQAFLGLLLLPVLILLMLYPYHGKLLLSIAASLYLIARLVFIFKGFRIFYGNLSSILYFLLYLCAVEIVPLAIMASVTYWISGIY